ncbi:YcxB family protein [Photobacterium sp. ZSDE20]|uniref:YcxB family protein n=1 Tax=Photobacterium pectinilyticum TaxID=2906793 RepID=A0ABT1N7W2_9GAMM|nr:YcxB family protein [Photobacterium sp. ZSDE20]MCQ1060192.1 YcxB family protein [Photobacterium sp. ZSDE20]MDD1827647.1 YcxB family protein [Photobacterium sp. ZSDE20]
MSKDFDFTTEYTLDKAFFAECYDQTSRPAEFPKDYLKGILFLLFGVVLIIFELLPSSYVGWFFIVLSIIEALSVYFKRTWWLWRQTLSMSSGSKVVFHVDSNGVSYKSGKNTRNIAWSEIDQLQQSDLGFILHMGKQRQYVSKSCLNDEVIAFMVEQHAVSKMN